MNLVDCFSEVDELPLLQWHLSLQHCTACEGFDFFDFNLKLFN